MHYKAMGDLGYTGSLNDRIHKYLTEKYGSFYEAMRDLRNGTSVFSLISAYAVNNFDPSLVFDFEQNYYRTGGTETTLNPAVTHTRAGQATMTDSDGEIKWAPHNLLIRSEELNLWTQLGTGSIVVDNAVAPDGTTTAATLTMGSTTSLRYILSSGTYTAGDIITYSFWARSDTVTSIGFGINGGASTGNNAIYANLAVTSTWNLVEFEFTILETDSSLYYIIGKQGDNPVNNQLGDIEIWHPHVYRSDLGGMVNNPAQPTGLETYVPTTSSAVYLPRVGHHIYNGNAWVNEGVLHESEARTNLLTYSSMESTGWNFQSGSRSATTWVLTGASDATTITTSTSTSGTGNRIYRTGIAGGSGVTCSASFYYKANTTVPFIHFRVGNGNGNGVGACINTATGALTTGYRDGSSSLAAFASQNVEDVGSGWRRFTATFPTLNTNQSFIMYFSDSSATTAAGFDGTETIDLAGCQYELGSTPSSYIPTSGSTVTRAAETLTVPAANLPWPTPVEVTGTELVTNGTFDGTGNVTNWTLEGTATNNNGVNKFDVTAGEATNVVATQTIALTIGGVYQMSFERLAGTVSCSVSAAGAGLPTSYSSTVGVETRTFVATASSALLLINSGTGSTTVILDNISVKEVNPLSVSIQIDGKMTYADDNDNNTTLPWRWRLDSSNILYSTISTAGTRTGQPRFIQQQATSGYDAVFGANNVYSPNVNVPFNFAGRYGSTFINGAHEGTLLTANTTPTILPDLSSTNLELGYIFMGTIGKFRVWSDDLTDTGIATASAPSTEPSLQLTFDGSSTSSFKVLDWSE